MHTDQDLLLAAVGRQKTSHFSSVVRQVSSTHLIHSPHQQSSYQGPASSEEHTENLYNKYRDAEIVKNIRFPGLDPIHSSVCRGWLGRFLRRMQLCKFPFPNFTLPSVIPHISVEKGVFSHVRFFLKSSHRALFRDVKIIAIDDVLTL